ncbi:hypothetical protein BJ912DRAFT_926132 [Pholiota molesta]|nr:hypothetical protein BJ912DRAFT_926132 [Pholiota molesta]
MAIHPLDNEWHHTQRRTAWREEHGCGRVATIALWLGRAQWHVECGSSRGRPSCHGQEEGGGIVNMAGWRPLHHGQQEHSGLKNAAVVVVFADRDRDWSRTVSIGMPKFSSVRFSTPSARTENRTNREPTELRTEPKQNRQNRFCQFCPVLEPVRTDELAQRVSTPHSAAYAALIVRVDVHPHRVLRGTMWRGCGRWVAVVIVCEHRGTTWRARDGWAGVFVCRRMTWWAGGALSWCASSTVDDRHAWDGAMRGQARWRAMRQTELRGSAPPPRHTPPPSARASA